MISASKQLSDSEISLRTDSRRARAAKAAADEPPIHLVANGQSESVTPDYNAMDRPAVYRKGHGSAAAAAQADPSGENDLDYLDIPAFLRRQAD